MVVFLGFNKILRVIAVDTTLCGTTLVQRYTLKAGFTFVYLIWVLQYISIPFGLTKAVQLDDLCLHFAQKPDYNDR